MKCQTNIGLFIVMLLMWLFVCATAFCMPMLCPFHHTFCDSQGDMVHCFDKRSIDIYSMVYSASGIVDTKYSPETGTDITFGYTQGYNNSAFYTHQPQMAYSSTEEDIMMFRWDMNGQMTHIGRPYTEQFRRHVWNEAGQLATVFGNEYCGYYAYDAQGNRVYKITGSVVEDQHNAGYPSYTAYFDDATLYVNPYMVVTPQGYTKHYYNGSQRIASRLGDYWELEDPSVDAEDELATADSLWLHTTTIIEPDHQDMEGDYQYIQADGSNLPIVSYGPYISSIQGLHGEDMLWTVFGGHSHEDDGGMTDDGVFYYHPDHLGSATWITSDRGQVVQYLHYMPFGELWENQQVSEYDERFKFTGKERDAETGYDYFGARYYLSLLGIWLSPDPLLDEYPKLSSYAYCNWNPINHIDPYGLDVYRYDRKDGKVYLERKTDDDHDQVGKFRKDPKTGKYVQRTDKNGNPKYYSDHRGNSNQIAKGILHDGISLKKGIAYHVGGDGQLTEKQLYDFMIILDEIAGCEISAYLYEDKKTGQKMFHINKYTDNTISESKTYPNLIDTEQNNVLKYIHTHGHAPNKGVATTPSEPDRNAKNTLQMGYPQIIMIILHNYGKPIRF